MAIFFSKSVGNFVDDTIWPSLPADAVEVSKADYRAFVEARNDGTKIVVGDEQGRPVLVDAPPRSTKLIAADVRAERDRRINAVQWRIERYRSQDAANTPTTDAPNTYAALLAYVQALRDVPSQTGFPSNVSWPTEPQ